MNDVTLFKGYVTFIRLEVLNLVLSKFIDAYEKKGDNRFAIHSET